MKRTIFTSACFVLLFASCKKEDIARTDDTVDAIQLQSSASSAFVSDWEPVPAASWQSTSSADGKMKYSYNRATPQLNASALRGGFVMAYAKGYNFIDQNMDKPMGLPFTFYLPYERMMHPYIWNIDKEQGGILVGLDMNKSMSQEFITGQNNIKMRYVVISPTYFTQNNITAQELGKLTYPQLMEKLGKSL